MLPVWLPTATWGTSCTPVRAFDGWGLPDTTLLEPSPWAWVGAITPRSPSFQPRRGGERLQSRLVLAVLSMLALAAALVLRDVLDYQAVAEHRQRRQDPCLQMGLASLQQHTCPACMRLHTSCSQLLLQAHQVSMQQAEPLLAAPCCPSMHLCVDAADVWQCCVCAA